jgi:hypothetical protein
MASMRGVSSRERVISTLFASARYAGLALGRLAALASGVAFPGCRRETGRLRSLRQASVRALILVLAAAACADRPADVLVETHRATVERKHAAVLSLAAAGPPKPADGTVERVTPPPRLWPQPGWDTAVFHLEDLPAPRKQAAFRVGLTVELAAARALLERPSNLAAMKGPLEAAARIRYVVFVKETAFTSPPPRAYFAGEGLLYEVDTGRFLGGARFAAEGASLEELTRSSLAALQRSLAP